MDELKNAVNRRQFIAASVAGLAGLSASAAAGTANEAQPADSYWKGKCVLITGGTAGIGKTAVLRFAKMGANVVFCARHEKAGKEVQTEVEKNGGAALFQKCDIQVEREVKKLIETAVKRFGPLDLAVNNAGVSEEPSDFTTASLQDILNTIQTNYIGTMYCLRYELEQMKSAKKGVVVNIASGKALFADPSRPGYSSSKAAVLGLTKSLAKAFAPHGVRVNALTPREVDHNMGWKNTEKVSRVPENPLQRLITMDEVVDAIVWLGSNQSTAMNGHNLILDGGASA